MNVVPLDLDAHYAVRALLPWYAARRIDPEDAAQVEAHLAGCASCRAELELDRRLLAAQPVSTAAGDVEHGLRQMHKLIRSEAKRAQAASAPWLRWLVGAQFAAIALLVAMIVLPPAGTDVYRALGAPSARAAPNAVAMFKPEATEQDIRSALRTAGARLVDGPTASNAYLLIVHGDDPAAALARLRAQPAVSLAESLDARPAR